MFENNEVSPAVPQQLLCMANRKHGNTNAVVQFRNVTFPSFLESADNTDLMFVNANLAGFATLGIIITVCVWWDRCGARLWASASASAAAGFTVGFIFGFPRTIAQPMMQDAPRPNIALAAPSAPSGREQTARAARRSHRRPGEDSGSRCCP